MFRLLLLMVGTGLITAGEVIHVPVQLGSDLHLPVAEACQYKGSLHFDVNDPTMRIGAYDGKLQGLREYRNRLKYDEDTCTITLKRLTMEDGRRFTVTVYRQENGRIITRDIKYEIISDPVTSGPYEETQTQADPLTSGPYEETQTQAEHTVRNVSQGSSDAINAFVSFCLSLDSPVNGLITLVLLIIQRCCKKLTQDGIDFGCQINCCITVLCQCSSIFTMYRVITYMWLLILVPIILIFGPLTFFGCIPQCDLMPKTTAFMDRFCCKFCSDDRISRCKVTALDLLSVLMFLIQVFFAVCIGVFYVKIDDVSRRGSPSYAYTFLAVFLSFVLKIGILIISRYKSHESKTTSKDDEENHPMTTLGPRDGQGGEHLTAAGKPPLQG